MNSPLIYYGGKGALAKKLVPLMPPHDKYVELFGGGASLLFEKGPVKEEVYNDVYDGVVSFFKVLQDEKLFHQFYQRILLTFVSRSEFLFCRDNWQETDDIIEKAARWFVSMRQSFSGTGDGWSFCVGEFKAHRKWITAVENLPRTHNRFKKVKVKNKDWKKVLEDYWSDGWFVYIDPPYVLDTRSGEAYVHEFVDEQHVELIQLLLEYPGMVMLSGYEHEIYKPLEDAGWDIKKIKMSNYAAKVINGKKRASRIEVVWRNPQCIEAAEGNFLLSFKGN